MTAWVQRKPPWFQGRVWSESSIASADLASHSLCKTETETKYTCGDDVNSYTCCIDLSDVISLLMRREYGDGGDED